MAAFSNAPYIVGSRQAFNYLQDSWRELAIRGLRPSGEGDDIASFSQIYRNLLKWWATGE